MTEDKLLDFASKRAALLNLSSAWGTDEDGVLLIQLITRIEQLTAEVERLTLRLAECSAAGSTMRTTVEQFHAENMRLREALEFYADPKHHAYVKAAGCNCIDADGGEIARAALENING